MKNSNIGPNNRTAAIIWFIVTVLWTVVFGIAVVEEDPDAWVKALLALLALAVAVANLFRYFQWKKERNKLPGEEKRE